MKGEQVHHGYFKHSHSLVLNGFRANLADFHPIALD